MKIKNMITKNLLIGADIIENLDVSETGAVKFINDRIEHIEQMLVSEDHLAEPKKLVNNFISILPFRGLRNSGESSLHAESGLLYLIRYLTENKYTTSVSGNLFIQDVVDLLTSNNRTDFSKYSYLLESVDEKPLEHATRLVEYKIPTGKVFKFSASDELATMLSVLGPSKSLAMIKIFYSLDIVKG